MNRTIVFIHGMYMTPLCWEHWVAHFEAKGDDCRTPAWPGRDQPVESLRRKHPDPELGRLTLRAVLAHLSDYIQSLGDKPVLIGHSMGALIAQLLLQRDLARAAVAVDSAPPQGVLTTRWSFLKSNWPHINPLAPQGQPIQMTFPRFQYTFVNGLPEAVQRAAYDRYVVPESRRVPGESLTGAARIDFTRAHAPLLLIAGSSDHIIPASLNRTNYTRYHRSAAPVDFKEFPGRTHFTIGQPGWEEVADYIDTWLVDKGI